MIRWESGSFVSLRTRAKALSEVSERRRPMATWTLLFTTLAFGVLSAPAAIAGAATGMPSPFVPPYPDFGYCGRMSGRLPMRSGRPLCLRASTRAASPGRQGSTGALTGTGVASAIRGMLPPFG